MACHIFNKIVFMLIAKKAGRIPLGHKGCLTDVFDFEELLVKLGAVHRLAVVVALKPFASVLVEEVCLEWLLDAFGKGLHA